MTGVRAESWAPPGPDELSWFLADAPFPCRPLPLEYSLDVEAFAFGFSRALESLYFPLYELHARLVDHGLYFASVPSAWAEVDVEAQLKRLNDSALRFTRDLRAAWKVIQSPEMEGYRRWLEAFPPADASPSEIAELLPNLKRTRANQWFAPTRAVFAPAALLAAGVGQTSAAEATSVVHEARTEVVEVGGRLLREAELRIGEQLVRHHAIEAPEDVLWLELDELREALRVGGSWYKVVSGRRAFSAPYALRELAPILGPPLADDSPRMYLLREVLALLR